jgi:hypothetical protein
MNAIDILTRTSETPAKPVKLVKRTRYQVRWATDGGSGLRSASGSMKLYTRTIALRIVRGLKQHGRHAWMSPLQINIPA